MRSAAFRLKDENGFASGGLGQYGLRMGRFLPLKQLLLHLELLAALGARILADASVARSFLRPEE